jgi:formylglycine-generating enzyme required for sulfatase activity
LPSEAEWEYAARASQLETYLLETPVSSASFAWTRENALGRTRNVGYMPTNGFGLADMLGNVREWTEDRWHADYTDAPLSHKAWLDGESEQRVVRGGAYLFPRQPYTSLAARFRAAESLRDASLGFRCARD